MNSNDAFSIKLTPALQKIVETFELAGLAVGIVKDDRLVYAQGVGVRNIETDAPITPESVFYTASISKTFVATAIMQLVEANKIKLDDPITKYLPYFKLEDERYRMITLQQMLSHTSGMPDVEDYHWNQPNFDEDALEKYVRNLQNESLLFSPEEAFAYSNMAYEVLGDLIAKVSGQSFEAYIEEHILEPLEMKNSTFVRRHVPSERSTSPHVRVPHLQVSPIYPDNREHTPSSTFHSNLIDLGNWAEMYLNRGYFQEKRFLNESSIDLMWRPYHRIGDASEEYIGLSWFIEPYDEDTKRFIYHEGGDIGFLANLAILPEEGFAIIVLANSALTPIWEITDIVLAAIRGLDFNIPKPPALLPLSQTLVEKGLTAAVEQALILKQRQSDLYDFDLKYFYFPAFHCLKILHQPQTAIDILQLYRATHPESDQAYQHLAWAYMQHGDNKRALNFINKALDLNPNNEDAANLLRQLQAKGN